MPLIGRAHVAARRVPALGRMSALVAASLLSACLASISPAAARGGPQPVSFSILEGVTGPAERSEARKLFTSAAEYGAYFGHEPPAGVDFSSEWLVLYAAGVKPSGGFEAKVESIALAADGPMLHVTTSLVSPSRDCMVTQALSSPQVVVRFARPATAPTDVRFHTHDVERACGSADKTQACRTDADCALVDDYCGGCNCRAALRSAPAPQCGNPVQCFRQPCSGSVARCREGACVSAPRETTR